MTKTFLVHGKTDQRGFFAIGLGLALFAVFAATGWGLVTLVDEPPQTAAGPEVPAASATSEPAGISDLAGKADCFADRSFTPSSPIANSSGCGAEADGYSPVQTKVPFAARAIPTDSFFAP